MGRSSYVLGRGQGRSVPLGGECETGGSSITRTQGWGPEAACSQLVCECECMGRGEEYECVCE